MNNHLFELRVRLFLADLARECRGLASLGQDTALAGRTRAAVDGLTDVPSSEALDDALTLTCVKPREGQAAMLQAFWASFYPDTLGYDSPAANRLLVGSPRYAGGQIPYLPYDHPRQSSDFLQESDSSLPGLPPYGQAGLTLYDDVSFFGRYDLPLDASGIESRLIVGSTITYYYPTRRHWYWLSWAGINPWPPVPRVNHRRVSIVLDQTLSEDVQVTVFGVEAGNSGKKAS